MPTSWGVSWVGSPSAGATGASGAAGSASSASGASGGSMSSLVSRTTIVGGTAEQRRLVGEALARIISVGYGRALSEAILFGAITVSIVQVNPLNAYADLPNPYIRIPPQAIDGLICCYFAVSGSIAPFDLDRLLAHEFGHLTGLRDSGENSMDNVNKWENPIMRQLNPTQLDRVRYEVPRFEPVPGGGGR